MSILLENVSKRYGQQTVVNNVSLEIEARCDFDERHAVTIEAEDRALGHVEYVLPAPPRVLAAEGDPLHAFDELAHLARRDDRKPAIRRGDA